MSAGAGQASPPALPLRLLCLNVNGLRTCAKRRELFHALREGPWHVVVLQEAHAASADEALGWMREGAVLRGRSTSHMPGGIAAK